MGKQLQKYVNKAMSLIMNPTIWSFGHKLLVAAQMLAVKIQKTFVPCVKLAYE